MKTKLVLAIIFSLAFFASWSQRPTADQITTKKGLLTIQPIAHGSVVLLWDSKTIYVDPYGGGKLFEGLAAPDLILITDIHQDHMNVETIKSLETSKAIIVAPQAVIDQLPSPFKEKAVALANGNTTTQLEISISAIPMYNLPEDVESRHTKGRGNGYILDLGGQKVYFSGDTEDIPEMRALKNIDVAFVCMNLPFTMDVNQAASAVLEFKPKIVYPYHYRGQDTEAFKKLVNTGDSKIDVRLRNWYPTN